jgi:uncharacterized membrane protein ArfC
VISHVHWWLFGLSFGLGLVLTFALRISSAKRQVPVLTSAGESESPTTNIIVYGDPPTTMIPVENSGVEPPPPTIPVEDLDVEPPTTTIPVENSGVESPTTTIPVERESPTTKIPVEKEFPTTKIPVAKEFPTTKIPAAKRPPRKRPPGATGPATVKIPKVVPYAPFGPGSARADARGNGPSGWMVKGRSDTRLYYTPDDATFDGTIAQVWFRDEESAVRAHFTPWRKSSNR